MIYWEDERWRKSSSFNPPVVSLSAASPQKPVKAANLTASFRVHGSNVSAIFSWDSSMAPPHQALIGYQVTWVELVPTNRRNSKKLPHSLISQSQILPPVSGKLHGELNPPVGTGGGALVTLCPLIGHHPSPLWPQLHSRESMWAWNLSSDTQAFKHALTQYEDAASTDSESENQTSRAAELMGDNERPAAFT